MNPSHKNHFHPPGWLEFISKIVHAQGSMKTTPQMKSLDAFHKGLAPAEERSQTAETAP